MTSAATRIAFERKLFAEQIRFLRGPNGTITPFVPQAGQDTLAPRKLNLVPW
jgi:hypothetical protein